MDEYIRKSEELEDGSTVDKIGDLSPAFDYRSDAFNANLVDKLDDATQKRIAAYFIEAIDEDIDARREWLDSANKVKPYLGFSPEDINKRTFKHASLTYDGTLASCLLRAYASVRSELLHPGGPAGMKIDGDTNEFIEQKAERTRDFINYYLTVTDKPFYADCERAYFSWAFYGSMFKKGYYDKLLGRPLSRFITPEDFIVNSDCTSLLDSTRITHVLHLTKREILLNQKNHYYKDTELSYLEDGQIDDDDDNKDDPDDVNLDAYTKRTLFPVYETHASISLEDFTNNNVKTSRNIPEPYIVTIDKTTSKLLSITRNWRSNDPKKERKKAFVGCKYYPGFGVYGTGLAHILGSNAIAATQIQRQILDTETYHNFPAGLRMKQMGQQVTDIIASPGEFVPVDTGGIPLKDCFMPFPYNGASPTSIQLMIQLQQGMKELGAASELGVLQDTPNISSTTAQILTEPNDRLRKAASGSAHDSFTEELQLLYDLFKETLDKDSFPRNNSIETITNDDFLDQVKIIPISDPSTNSTVQRLMKANAIMQTAQQNPELHDMHAVYKMVYRAQNLDDDAINEILLPDSGELVQEEVRPLDPYSENINMSQGKPVKAAIWQDHPAHKLDHADYIEQNKDKPELVAEGIKHIYEHDVLEALKVFQEETGILPPFQFLDELKEIEDIDVQNAIAIAMARAIDARMKKEEEQAAEPPIDPNQVMMEEIRVRELEANNKLTIANMKAEIDSFRAQLDFEGKKAKIESDEDIAQLKSETELTKADASNEIEIAKLEQ